MPRILPSSEHFGTVDRFIENRTRYDGFKVPTGGDPNGAKRAFTKFSNSPLLVARRNLVGLDVKVFGPDDLATAITMYDPFHKV